jgi:hypothetical protein
MAVEDSPGYISVNAFIVMIYSLGPGPLEQGGA